jgi:hypothetical protein
MTASARTLRIVWAGEVPDDIRDVAEYSVREFAPLFPEHVNTLVVRFLEENGVEHLPGRATPMAFVSHADEGVAITIMLHVPSFHAYWLHAAILRAILDLHFDERPEHWWPALSFLLEKTGSAESYLLPPTGIAGVAEIYRRVMREHLTPVLDLLAGEIGMLRGETEFAPLWNRKNVPHAARVVAMMEYDFNPIYEAGPEFLNYVDEKGWSQLTERWVEEQLRHTGAQKRHELE